MEKETGITKLNLTEIKEKIKEIGLKKINLIQHKKRCKDEILSANIIGIYDNFFVVQIKKRRKDFTNSVYTEEISVTYIDLITGVYKIEE